MAYQGVPLPAEMPSLNAIPPSGGDMAGKASAVPRLFFNVEKSLDDIARVAPSVANEIDEVKATLRGILARAVNGAEPTPEPGEFGPEL